MRAGGRTARYNGDSPSRPLQGGRLRADPHARRAEPRLIMLTAVFPHLVMAVGRVVPAFRTPVGGFISEELRGDFVLVSGPVALL